MYALIVIIILLLAVVLLIRTEKVQTYITQKVAGYYSEEWGTTVQVDRVYLEFFKTAVIEGLYVEDLHKDTLLYAKRIEAELALFSLQHVKGQLLNFDEIALNGAVFNLKKYKDETGLNLTFIIEYFAKEDTTKAPPWEVTCNHLGLNDVKFTYENQNQEHQEKGIDFNHLDIAVQIFQVEDIKIAGADIWANITQLSLIEGKRFKIKQLATQLELKPQSTKLGQLEFLTDNTRLYSSIQFDYSSFSSFASFMDSVKLNSTIDSGFISTEDLAHFAPNLQGMGQHVYLQGEFKGWVSHLKAKKLFLQYANNTVVEGSFDIEGLPDIENTFIFLNLDNFSTTASDISKIPVPPFGEKKTLTLPNEIYKLGKVNFNGRFTGFINDFVADGTMATALGTVNTDIAIFKDTIYDTYDYVGNLNTYSFNLGELIGKKTLFGTVALDLNVDGRGFSANEVIAKLNGKISRFDFKAYPYSNITVNAQVANKQFDGNLQIRDKNIVLGFNGKVDYSGELPVFAFDADMDSTRLANLHLLNRDKSSYLSMQLSSNLKGDDIDELDGKLLASGIYYREGDKEVVINKTELLAKNQTSGKRMLNLESDIVSANVVGNFNASQVTQAVKYELSKVFPTFFTEEVEPAKEKEDFTYTITFYDAQRVADIFKPEFKAPGFVNIVGNFNSANHIAAMQINTSEVSYNSKKVKGLVLDVELNNQVVTADAKLSEFFVSDSLSFKNISSTIKAVDDNMQFTLNWSDQKDSANYSGDINGLAEIQGNKKYKVELINSYFTVADTVWKIEEGNSVMLDSTAVTVKSFRIAHRKQYLDIAGKISENKADRLNVNLNDFDLRNFNLFTAGLGMELEGKIAGNATVAGVYKQIDLKSDLRMNELKVNKYHLGNGKIETSWDDETSLIKLAGNLMEKNGEGVNFRGTYNPKKKKNSLNITTNMKRFKLGILQPFIADHVSDFDSQVSGKIKLTGTPEEPLLNGKLTLHKTTLKVNYLNTQYTTEQTVLNVMPDMFSFDAMPLWDANGNKALVNGTILHENFADINFDISIDASRFQVLNTTESQNSVYYGTANMSGLIDVSGYADNLIIEARLKTDKGTKFNIPLGGPTEVENIDYIKFVDADSIFAQREDKEDYKAKVDGLQLNFEIEATPDAEMRLVFDESIGDVMTARGSGNLKMEINTLGRFNMYGTYVIDKGDYLLTLQNVINKKFQIEEGSSITWNGDPLQAQLDIDAIYNLRAPLYDIMGGDSTYRKRVPVDVHLLVTEKLEEPEISFDIELPTVDQTTASIVKSQIRSPQEMNQQVFTLLLLNRFKSPSRNTAQRSNVGTTTSTELLSNQLSNWLSQISDEFDIGVNYRAGDEVTNEELEVALSTQILNDRVVLEGNLGVEGNKNQTNNNTIVGDFKVEYKITEDGQLRAKVFNETNDNLISATSSPYTQGAGLVYTKEFNSFGEFLKNIFRKKEKGRKEEE